MTAAAGALSLTLADIAKLQDPKGNIAAIIEILSVEDSILEDMQFMEGNLPTGHLSVMRSGIPAGTWRKLNYGVMPEKATTVQVTDTCGMLESYAETDAKILKLSGNPGAVRASMDRAFIIGLRKSMATAVIYGDQTIDPEKITGLAPRFNDRSAENGENIISAGAQAADNTSIWLVAWGDNTCHGIYPKGSKAGLDSKDLGEVTLEDAAGGKYQGFRTHYTWDTGLALPDWRYVARIANIHVPTLQDPDAAADLLKLMGHAIEMLPDQSLGRPVFYCNRDVRIALRDQATDKVKNSTLSMNDIGGRRVLSLDSTPIRRIDAILSTEALVA